jgi:hypothetical protein
MIFTLSSDEAVTRAASVLDLLTRDHPARTAGWLRVGAEVTDTEAVSFDAAGGYVYFDDLDGEPRSLMLPEGITAEAVAAVVHALSLVGRAS